jgi:single-strand DNA-binding protein
MNSVVLVGRLTRDPDVRYNPNGMGIARFTVAVDRRIKREGQPEADFISCVAFGKTAEFLEKYFTKGKLIGLSGSIQTGSYTNKDGQKVYTTDVVAENVEFVGSKNESGGNAGGRSYGNDRAAEAPSAGGDDFPPGFEALKDDDMPF